MLLCQIGGRALDRGKDLTRSDRRRHLPIRPEDHVTHTCNKNGRLVAISLANDYIHRRSDFELLVVRTKTEFRDVGDDGRVLVFVRHPAPAVERELHLANAADQGNVQFRQRSGIDSSIRSQAVPRYGKLLEREVARACLYVPGSART